MILSTSQLQTLKAWINSNMPGQSTGDILAALNATASPDYWVWKSSVSRAECYNATSPTGSTWDWTTYKNQGVSEQNAWTQMFMGDVSNFGQLNVRSGVSKIFTGSAQANAQRDHILAVARRKATTAEKLFGVAVTSPPANTGNDGIAGNRGLASNPDVLGAEGTIDTQNVIDAINSYGKYSCLLQFGQIRLL